MSKKYIVITIIVLMLIIGSSITFKIALDFNKETKIKNEISEITKYLEINEDNNLAVILDRRIITKGPYSEVEKSIKLYYKNLYSSLDNLNFLLDEDNFTNYLSSKNLNEDKPSFIKSKNNLQNSKAQMEENYNRFIDTLTNNSTKITFLTDKDLKRYYRDFYLELTSFSVKDEFSEKIESSYKETLNKIEIYNEIFDFLAANKGHWEIQNDAIVFDDTIIYEEYVNITEKINSNTIIEDEENDKEVSES